MSRLMAQHRRNKRAAASARRLVAILILLFVAMFPTPSPAASATVGRPPFLETSSTWSALLLQDADANGHFRQHTLIAAALVAGGVENGAAFDRLTTKFQRHREYLAASLQGRAKGEQGRIVWRYLHDHLLRGSYIENQTRVAEVLQSGDFNCLSACVLFTCLCREFSIAVEPCVVRGHIFCRLPDVSKPGGGLIVELTADMETHAFLDVEKIDLLDPIYLQPSRRLSDAQLIAKIFYNRAAYLAAEKRFSDAALLYEASLRLDPEDANARENRLANLCQWALALSDQSKLTEAERVLEHAWRIDAAYAPLRANARHIDQKRIVQLYREGCIETALALIQRGVRRQPNAQLYPQARNVLEKSPGKRGPQTPVSDVKAFSKQPARDNP